MPATKWRVPIPWTQKACTAAVLIPAPRQGTHYLCCSQCLLPLLTVAECGGKESAKDQHLKSFLPDKGQPASLSDSCVTISHCINVCIMHLRDLLWGLFIIVVSPGELIFLSPCNSPPLCPEIGLRFRSFLLYQPCLLSFSSWYKCRSRMALAISYFIHKACLLIGEFNSLILKVVAITWLFSVSFPFLAAFLNFLSDVF